MQCKECGLSPQEVDIHNPHIGHEDDCKEGKRLWALHIEGIEVLNSIGALEEVPTEEVSTVVSKKKGSK